MLRFVTLIAGIVALAPLAGAEAGTWTLDGAHSSVQFAVRHLMISTVRGEFGTVQGTVTGDPANPAGAVVEATIDAASIDTRNADRDAHLKKPDFLDVAKYPTITFRSKAIQVTGPGKAKVTGDLTLHGVTKEIVLDVEGPSPVVKDPWGKTKAGAHASTRIARKDFGITWNKTMDGGGLVVGDEIEITIDVEATRTGG